jgi:Zn-dependent M28 family amino/carboxypeptidase
MLILWCGLGTAGAQSAQVKAAESVITPAALLAPIKELSSDAYTGRAPGTEGETKSVAYIIAQCKAIGLHPGNPDGSWTQKAELWGILPQHGALTLRAQGKDVSAVAGTDYIVWTSQPVERTDIPASGIVFVGYGVTAPDYKWDDYAGINVTGKTVVILSGDPPVADPKDPSKLDDAMFQGRALTYYGRTTTKLEDAYRHGAAAVLFIAAAVAPFNPHALFENYTRETMTIRGPQDRQRVKLQAMIVGDKAAALFAAAGQSLPALKAAAARPGFRAVPLDAQATFALTARVRKVDSSNIIAKIEGSDPKLKHEYVIYSGHWDHHGQVGDKIFHGASDNAAGTSGMLALAHAFLQLKPAPRRTILFLWPTAEEKGLIGARYYVEHPLYPLASTVADINLDYFSNWGWGRTKDFSIVGLGNSTLDDITAAIVHQQGRVLTGDTAPEQGFYYRSDHFEFARKGVPSIETSPGIDYVGRPSDFGTRMRAEYIAHDYHQPSDVIKPGWNLTGAVEDLDVLFELGYRVAQTDARPQWKPDAIWRPRQE